MFLKLFVTYFIFTTLTSSIHIQNINPLKIEFCKEVSKFELSNFNGITLTDHKYYQQYIYYNLYTNMI